MIKTKIFKGKQQGVALVISLIFLLLITIIGVSGMRGSTLNEMMAANAQQKSISFQIAESTIQRVWQTDTLLTNTPAVPLNNPPLQTINMDADFDKGTLDVDADATIQYCGESFDVIGSSTSADESAPTLVAHLYSIHGIGEIPSVNAVSDHDQRGYFTRFEAGRTGNCP